MIYFIAVLCLQTIKNDSCKNISSNCEWDDNNRYYSCYVFGTSNAIAIRRLELLHYVEDIDVQHLDNLQVHVTLPQEMEDIEVFWNDEYILLSVGGSYYYNIKKT